jgi:hypothetical protein
MQALVLGSIPGVRIVLVVAIFVASVFVSALSMVVSSETSKEVAMGNNNVNQSDSSWELIRRSGLSILATMGTMLAAGAALP